MRAFDTKPQPCGTCAGHAALRRGRHSVAGQTYVVTCATAGRLAIFADLLAARQVIGCLRFSDTRAWTSTLAYVVMPDHMHWLFELGSVKPLARVIQSVKGYSARRINQLGFRTRPVWQDAFHDRSIRAEDDLRSISRYIVANPLRAGLVEQLGDYPHWDAVWMDSYLD